MTNDVMVSNLLFIVMSQIAICYSLFYCLSTIVKEWCVFFIFSNSLLFHF